MTALRFPHASLLHFGWIAGGIAVSLVGGADTFPTMPDRGRVVAVYDGSNGSPVEQGWQESREGAATVVTTESAGGAWWITDTSNGPDGLTYGLNLAPEEQEVMKRGWTLEVEVDLRESDTPRSNANLAKTTCDLRVMAADGKVLKHLTFAFTKGTDDGKGTHSWEISGTTHNHQPGDKVQLEMRPGKNGSQNQLEMRISGWPRQTGWAQEGSCSPARIEWGSPASDGTSRAGWRQVKLYLADWKRLDDWDSAARDLLSGSRLGLETGLDFSLPWPGDLEYPNMGTPPLAAVEKGMVVCAPAYNPGDEEEELMFILGRPSMVEGLEWNVSYRRGTPEMSRIIVMERDDSKGAYGRDWLQDWKFKRSGIAKPGETAPALVERYRAEMIRMIDSDPKLEGKRPYVEAGARMVLTLDQVWTKHRKGGKK